MSECAILTSILLVVSVSLVFLAAIFCCVNDIQKLLENVYEEMKAAKAGKEVTK